MFLELFHPSVDRVIGKFNSVINGLDKVATINTVKAEDKNTEITRLRAEVLNHSSEVGRALKIKAKITKLLSED